MLENLIQNLIQKYPLNTKLYLLYHLYHDNKKYRNMD